LHTFSIGWLQRAVAGCNVRPRTPPGLYRRAGRRTPDEV